MQTALVTGGTGFLGTQIVDQLRNQFYEVLTLGRQAKTDIRCNLATEMPTLWSAFDLVVHAAGKAHVVPKNPAEEAEFFKINYDGTVNLCSAFDKLKMWPKQFVFISTVSVYGLEKGELISETAPLLGSTPYAKSKIKAEAFLQDWSQRNGVKLSILRLPLIAGANPPGNLGTMIQGIKNKRYFNIGKGAAKKSVVLASDVGKWIPRIAEKGGVYNLTDGYHPSFAELATLIAKQLDKHPVASIPGWLATCMALAGNFLGAKAPINSDKLHKITATLTFDDRKARKAFGWNPDPVLEDFIIS